MKNYLWEMFSNIKNAQLAKKTIIYTNRKKFCEDFLNFLWSQGFIIGYKINNKNKIKIFLKYIKNKPVINCLRTVSKPSRRAYFSSKKIWKISPKKSFFIFSTNKGLKSLLNCKKENIGGELFLILN
jgi:small subunit ribosomal protein S8